MGSLCSCFKSSKDEDQPEESRGLLPSNSEITVERSSINGDQFYHREPTYGTLTDSVSGRLEASMWSRTLEKMASDVIDVSTVDITSSNIDHSDLMDRQKQYSSRLAASKINQLLKKQRVKPSFASSPNTLTLSREMASRLKLAADPIDQDDLALIREFSEKSLNAYKAGYTINVKDDLVVQFDPQAFAS